MKSPVAYLALFLVVCQLFAFATATHDQAKEDELVGKYEKILDEFDNEQPASLKNLFKAKRVDRLKSDYDKLNAELIKRLPNSEDPNENLQAASEWLKSGGDKNLAEALEYFVSLGELNEDEKCNGRSETILRLNDYLTDGRARSDDTQVAARRTRLDKIVRHFAVQHEQQCRDVYAQKYQQKLAEMKDEQKERLFELLSDQKLATMMTSSSTENLLVELMFISSNLRLAEKFKPTNKLLASYIFNSLIYQTMKREEPFITNGAFSRANFDRDYEELLIEPCQNYVSVLGREVFQPAILDLGTSNEVLKRLTMGDDEARYVFGLGRFAICDSVLRQGNSFKQLVLKESEGRYKS